LSDKFVDVALPVTLITALDVVLELALPPATSRVRELERPEEVGNLFEVGTDGDDLVNEIFDREDVVFSELLLDDGVGSERQTLVFDFPVPSLADKLPHRLQVGLAIGDIWFNESQHLLCGLGDLDKHPVVNLEKP